MGNEGWDLLSSNYNSVSLGAFNEDLWQKLLGSMSVYFIDKIIPVFHDPFEGLQLELRSDFSS